MGMRSSGGEIGQVEGGGGGGGHIVRSTGRKDRHSKVYTAKGPRDRRVRLSAHTAIEFYDVQDRLGYDRPSKAVDWLIKKAKPSIDKLAYVPPWHIPMAETAEAREEEEEEENKKVVGSSDMGVNNIVEQPESNSGYGFYHHSQHMDTTDPIAFFPTTSSTNNSSINFQNYPSDIISRATIPQDLGLSLHSFQQAPISNHHHHNQSSLYAAGPTNFESQYQKILTWNTDASPGGFTVVNHPQQFLGHVGGTHLHSSFSPPPSSLRSWTEIPMNPNSNSSEQQQERVPPIHHGSIFGSRFLSDGLAGFCIPATIQGEEEDHGGVGSNTTSSASHNSHH